jgi:hypothetical protein
MSKTISYPFPVEKLKSWTLQDVIDQMRTPETLVQGADSTSVIDALKTMHNNGVSAYLVYRKAGDDNEYECFITLKDIIQFVVFQALYSAINNRKTLKMRIAAMTSLNNLSTRSKGTTPNLAVFKYSPRLKTYFK